MAGKPGAAVSGATRVKRSEVFTVPEHDEFYNLRPVPMDIVVEQAGTDPPLLAGGVLAAKVAGTYMATACVEWANTNEGYNATLIVAIRKGTTELVRAQQSTPSAGTNTAMPVPSPPFHLDAGQTVGLAVLHSRGAAGIDLSPANDYSPVLALVLIAAD